MKDKYKMTREENVFYAKRQIVDVIWKSANLEGIAATYPDTYAIYNGINVGTMSVDDIITINNLKHAWNFVLEHSDEKMDMNYLRMLHVLTAKNLICFPPGDFRFVDVKIGGTDWRPPLPNEFLIRENLDKLLAQTGKSTTEIAIEVMLYVMRTQMFIDGNKRVAMLAANKIMIDGGCGIITIPPVLLADFTTKLLRFYETGEPDDIKMWIYDNCIDGVELTDKKEVHK